MKGRPATLSRQVRSMVECVVRGSVVAIVLGGLAAFGSVAVARAPAGDWLTAVSSREQRPNALVSEGLSPDGRTFAWSTTERVLASDHNASADVYVRRHGRVALVTSGPGERFQYGPHIVSVSNAGAVLFWTDKRLVRADRDQGNDLYRWQSGHFRLLTSGSRTEEDPWMVPGKVTPDLSYLVFSTSRPLTRDDTNGDSDVYELHAGRFRWISRPAPGGSPGGASYADAVSPSGSQVVFESSASLTPDDQSGETKIFRWSQGRLARVSSNCAAGSDSFIAADLRVDHVLFRSKCRLSSADHDNANDLYEWSPRGTHLISTGPLDPQSSVEADPAGMSSDGRRVLFETFDRLTADDHHPGTDIYERADGHTKLISPNGYEPPRGDPVPVLARTRDLKTIYFVTSRRISRSDRDNLPDLYRWSGGRTTYVGCKPTGGVFNSSDLTLPAGAPAVFASYQRCGTRHRGRSLSLYAWRNGRFRRLSSIGQYEGGVLSADGRRVFLTSRLPVNEHDRDGGDFDVSSFALGRR